MENETITKKEPENSPASKGIGKSRELFREVQYFRQSKLISVLVVVAMLFLGAQAVYLFFKIRPISLLSVSGAILFLFTCGIIYLVFFVIKLIVEVRKDGIEIRFYPFVTKTVRFKEIEHVEARTYKPIREYGGWGIRKGIRGHQGGAYTIRGNKGVQLELRNGERFLIGSQETDRLAEVIHQRVDRVKNRKKNKR